MKREDRVGLALAVHLDRDGAVEEMVRAYQDRLYGFALRLLNNSEDAREVTQDAFVRAYQCLAFKYDRRKCRGLALKPWLFQVTRNLALNRLRSKRRSEGLAEPLESVDLFPAAPDGLNDPFRNLEKRTLLEGALARLVPEQRELVALRFVEGMSYGEIAAVTGAGESAARGKIFRALKKLRVVLGEE